MQVTFHNAQISANATGESFDVDFYKEANILFNVKSITPSVIGGGGDTTLNAAASKNDKTISIVSETNFTTDDWAYIGTGTTREYVKIKSVAAGALTLYTGLMFAHSSGEEIKECERAHMNVTVEISPNNSDFTHRQAIINEETEGDLERITAPPDWETEIFTCGKFQAQINKNLGKWIRANIEFSKSGGSPSFEIECIGNFQE